MKGKLRLCFSWKFRTNFLLASYYLRCFFKSYTFSNLGLEIKTVPDLRIIKIEKRPLNSVSSTIKIKGFH